MSEPTLYRHYNQDEAPEGWTVMTRALSDDDSITYVVPVEACEHGNYAEHVVRWESIDPPHRFELCDGKPKGDSV